MTRDLYRESGVDIDAGNEAASRYADLAARTGRPEVRQGIGGFSGGFRLDVRKYPQPLLVSGTDGVGTKLKVAFAVGQHDTIGIDCVAMCVNDILTCGAEPLFFLDYLAVGVLDVDTAEAVVSGVAAGCEQAGCALIGGETAEMGDVYAPGEYDLAGNAVGVVNEDACIDGTRAQAGDILIGLESTGVHSNGFSLIRKLIAEAGVGWQDQLPGFRGTVAQELLRPTAIYVRSVQALIAAKLDIRGMAHITGGGLPENLPRCLPDNVNAVVDVGSWPIAPVFGWLRQQSELSFAAAARVWNMGIGYVIVIAQADAKRALEVLHGAGQAAHLIGEIEAGSRSVRFVGEPTT